MLDPLIELEDNVSDETKSGALVANIDDLLEENELCVSVVIMLVPL